MRIFKRAGKGAAFLGLFVLVNMLMTFLLTPYSSPSTEMWDGYWAQAGNNLDMIYIGTSQCYESINPQITDKITGLRSYNMGTNAQSLMDTERALEQAFTDHEISYVDLVLDYDCLMTGKERYARPEASFIYAMNRHLPFGRRVRNAVRFVTDPKYFGQSQSLNFWFPWLNNRSNMHFEYILQNAWAKLTGVSPEPDDINNIRNSSGYKGFHGVINYDTAEPQKKTSWKESKVSGDALAAADRICQLCRENGARLTVLVTPVPTSAVLCFEDDYFTRMDYVSGFFEERGARFFDFNLAKPELFSARTDYYKDWIHLNDNGAESFSRSAALLHCMLYGEDTKEDPEDLFYTPEEYLASINYVDSVYLKLSSNPGEGIQGTAIAYTGSGVEVEYEIQVRSENSSKYIIIREYDTEADFHFDPDRPGTWYFKVNARLTGSGVEFQRCHTASVEYWLR